MKTEEKVLKKIAEAIQKHLTDGSRQDVILEFTQKKKEITSPKVSIAPDGITALLESGYHESGFKCFSKKGRVNTKHAYLVFETDRIAPVLGSIRGDIANIESDVHQKQAL